MLVSKNEILEKNLLNLKQEDLRHLVGGTKMHSQVEVGVECIEERKVLYIIKDGEQFQLDSLYNSEEILNRWFAQLDNINYRSRYLLFGLGNGMYVRKILQSAGKESVIIVVEPSLEIFQKVIEEFDISDILSNTRVVIIIPSLTKQRFIDVLRISLQYEDMPGAVCRSYLNYPILFSEQYNQFDNDIKHHSNSVKANRTVIIRMGHAYYNNFFCNYNYFAKGKSLIALNKALPKNIPAILVSAGPSLDKNIEILKKAKNKAFILAADSAVRALVQHDITPDAMICIDALKSHEHFNDDRIKNIPLIANLISSRTALMLHEGDKYFLHDNNPYIEEIFEKFEKVLPVVAGGGSVATDAYALLERLQFETIILVGQDLAYTNRKTHAKNTIRGEKNKDISEEILTKVEDINGEIIDTSYEFQIYLDWFIEEIENNPKINVVDATEGGAKIAGTRIMTLQNAIDYYCNKYVDIDTLLKNIPYRLTEEEQTQFLNYIHELPGHVEKIKILVDEVYADYKKVYSLIQQNKCNVPQLKRFIARTAPKVKKIENASVFYFVELTLQPALDEILEEDLFLKKENESELETSIKQALKYFETMKKEVDQHVDITKWAIRNYGNEEIKRQIYFGKNDGGILI